MEVGFADPFSLVLGDSLLLTNLAFSEVIEDTRFFLLFLFWNMMLLAFCYCYCSVLVTGTLLITYCIGLK